MPPSHNIMAKCNAAFLDDLELMRPDCQVVWNSHFQRFQIIHTHPHNPKWKRVLFTIKGERGEFRQPDWRDIVKINQFAWDTINKFRDQDLYIDYVLEQNRIAEESREKDRRAFVDDYLRDNKRKVSDAVDNTLERIAKERKRNKRKGLIHT